MTDLANIAGRVFNTPLAIDGQKAAVILESVGPRLLNVPQGRIEVIGGDAIGEKARQPAASLIGDSLHKNLMKEPGRGYGMVGGIAVVPVMGTLVRRGAWVGSRSGETSYEGLSAVLRAAAANPQVTGIALEIDSFGGEAAGVWELAALVRELRQDIKIKAFISDYALSAGYAIASQAHDIVMPEFGMAGSIGVVVMHADYSGHLEKEGVKVTFIHAGEHKMDGNAYEPLPEAVRAEIQSGVDKHYAAFALTVAEGRGNRMSAKQAMETEARCLTGPDALAAGLVDAVGDVRAAFDAFVDENAPRGLVPVPRSASALAGPAFAGAPSVDPLSLAPRFGRDTLDAAAALLSGAVSLNSAAPAAETEGQDAPLTQERKAKPMSKKPEKEQPEAEVQTASADVSQIDAASDTEQKSAARADAIMERCEMAGLPISFARKLVKSGCSLEKAYAAIIDEKAVKAEDGGDIANVAPKASVTSDVVDRTKAGLTEALLMRAGMDGGKANEFTGMSLREMARQTLTARNLVVSKGGALAVVGAAFQPAAAGGMHSTSDFGVILENIAEKSMLRGFEEVEETFEKWTSVGTMGDFKPTRRAGLSAFSSLAKVAEGAEFTYGKMGDHGELAVLATYGRLFAITRQAIINDDMDAFTAIPNKMGRAARRTIGDLAYGVVMGNPEMEDGNALFSTEHANLAAAGGAPSEATVNAAITAMARQKDRSKQATALNIAAKYLLAPPELRSVVLQTLRSEHAPDDTAKAGGAKQPRAYNTVRDAAEPIFDARLTGSSWYMAADAMAADTVEIGYLDGQRTPFLDQQNGWSIDGTEFKVRIDATATATAWEGLYKNPGA